MADKVQMHAAVDLLSFNIISSLNQAAIVTCQVNYWLYQIPYIVCITRYKISMIHEIVNFVILGINSILKYVLTV